MITAPTNLDFYKTFHPAAYAPGVSGVYSNFTARHGGHSNISGGKTSLVGGLQAAIWKVIVKEWNEFFAAPSEDEAVALYEMIVSHGLGRPERATHLRSLYQLGFLPLEFRGLKEGLEVAYGIPHFTVQSTVEGFGWLTNMIETVISAEVWPVHTALTTANEYRRVFEEYAIKTGFPVELTKYQGHDFSFRGMMGVEAAKLTGMGHLMSGFVGSDTIPAAISLHQYYGADISPENPCATIASVDATEHSVECSFEQDDEAYIDHCMDVASPSGILSIVSDGYDFWKLVTEFIPARKEKIMQRDGKIVIRPDSGDPVKILTGYNPKAVTYKQMITGNFWADDYEHDAITWEHEGKRHYALWSCDYWPDGSPTNFRVGEELTEVEVKGLVEFLWDTFGGTYTQGYDERSNPSHPDHHKTRVPVQYKLMDQHIGCIYGDSITLDRQQEILERLEEKGFCSGNVVLGIGSFTYQYVTRDTHGSAVKATSIVKDGKRIPIFKDPKTGDSTKKSAKGLLFVSEYQEVGGELEYILSDDVSEEDEQSEDNMLERIWKDGTWYREQTLEEIREIVQSN